MPKVRRFGSYLGSGCQLHRPFLNKRPKSVSVNVVFLPKVSQCGSPTRHIPQSSKVRVFGISKTPILCGLYSMRSAEGPLYQLTHINQASRKGIRRVDHRVVRTFGSCCIEQLPPAVAKFKPAGEKVREAASGDFAIESRPNHRKHRDILNSPFGR